MDSCSILSGISATLCRLFQLCRLVPKVVPSLIFGWNRFLLCRSSSYAVCSNVPVFWKSIHSQTWSTWQERGGSRSVVIIRSEFIGVIYFSTILEHRTKLYYYYYYYYYYYLIKSITYIRLIRLIPQNCTTSLSGTLGTGFGTELRILASS